MAVTSNQRRPVTVMEDLEKRWKDIKALRKDGLVTVLTSLGAMLFQLNFSQAPIACDNFAQHCANGYYVGTSFHRVIPGFMAQGGDPTGTGRGGESAFASEGGAKTFRDEFTDLRHDARGVLAMANSGPGTNGSQFYITFAPTPHLNLKHTVFGRLISGAAVLEKIEKAPVDSSTDRPENPITIVSTSVSERPEPHAAKETKTGVGGSAGTFGTVQSASQIASDKISNAELGVASSVGALFGAAPSVGSKKRKRLALVAPPGLKHSKVSKKSSSGSKNKGQKFGNFSGW
jgi:peptidyl-prolyl cis-trans isomerase-like protein 2